VRYKDLESTQHVMIHYKKHKHTWFICFKSIKIYIQIISQYFCEKNDFVRILLHEE